MADSIWQTGKLTMVMHPVGKREADQSPRYKRALFDVLSWTKPGQSLQEIYVLPIGFEATRYNIAGQQEHQLGMEFGFYTGDVMVIEPHESAGQNDGWLGCHCFGYL